MKFFSSAIFLCVLLSLLLSANYKKVGAASMVRRYNAKVLKERSETIHYRRRICQAARSLNCVKEEDEPMQTE
ncbi:unnamed protein product [Porites evermanni]|uniref:Uncharacterized protein n=1 Tax=Porites evermanni TaxID=104178 RepID=A0ABN8T1U9_9CNID|nr:unnamed protein product [Porites evermanni]